jgi:hypothetical protein
VALKAAQSLKHSVLKQKYVRQTFQKPRMEGRSEGGCPKSVLLKITLGVCHICHHHHIEYGNTGLQNRGRGRQCNSLDSTDKIQSWPLRSICQAQTTDCHWRISTHLRRNIDSRAPTGHGWSSAAEWWPFQYSGIDSPVLSPLSPQLNLSHLERTKYTYTTQDREEGCI